MKRRVSILCGLLVLVGVPACGVGEPAAGAVAAFNAYVGSVEARLGGQHLAREHFLVAVGPDRLMRGELVVEEITPGGGAALPGALLHHWRGTAFAPGARAADFERLMKDFEGYPQHFSPQVLEARVVERQGDVLQASMRVRQKHVIAVVMDSSYDVSFGRLDAGHGYSVSRSTRIAEIDGAGTRGERVLSSSEEHGFLWRLNTYWSYEERDGGLYMQIESVSLSRSIPTGLGWAVRPFVESVPRDSLEFTLRSVCNALRR